MDASREDSVNWTGTVVVLFLALIESFLVAQLLIKVCLYVNKSLMVSMLKWKFI